MQPNSQSTIEAFARLEQTLALRTHLAQREHGWLRHLKVVELLTVGAQRDALLEGLNLELAQARSGLESLSRAHGGDGSLLDLERLCPDVGVEVRRAVEAAKAAARELARVEAFNQSLAQSALRLLQGIVARLAIGGRSYDGSGLASPLPALTTRSTTA